MSGVSQAQTGYAFTTKGSRIVGGVVLAGLLAVLPVASDAQTVTRVSVGAGGVQANGLSAGPTVSGDGRFVAFSSGATNLVTGDTNGRFDSFVADRVSGVVTRVSVATDGTQGNGNAGASAVSASGRYVVFLSFASNLVPNDTNAAEDVFVRDRDADADGVFDEAGAVSTIRVSVKSDGSQATSPANSGAFNPSISPSGRFVIFESGSTDLVAGDTNGRRDAFVHDRDADADGIFDEPGAIATTRVSVATGGGQGTGGSAVLLLGPYYISDAGEACFTTGHNNLVAGDTNGAEDAFCRNPTTGTTVRVSVAADGAQATGQSFARGLSATGRYVLFESAAANVVAGDTNNVTDLFIRDRDADADGVFDEPGASTTVRVSVGSDGSQGTGGAGASLGDLSANGRFAAFAAGFTNLVDGDTNNRADVFVRDRDTDGNGVFDEPSGVSTTRVSLGPAGAQADGLSEMVAISANGSVVGFDSVATNLVAGDTNNQEDVFAVELSTTGNPSDTDSDGLPNTWETQFGLDPSSGSGDDGASGDPDGDGRTNAQELAAGTHPRGFHQRYLAEGAINTFFDVRLALLNVGSAAAHLQARFLQPGGATASIVETLAPLRRRTLTRTELSPLLASPDFSTVVEADQPIVLDRTMSWDATGYGSHAETGVAGPATTWYLAEGSTSGDFALFYLLQNPNPTATTATVRYLLPPGQAPIEKQYALAPNSRTTIPVDGEGPAFVTTDVSAVITAPVPIIAERAMYFSRPGQVFAAGHGSAGVTAPATSWFLAEGATGPFFDLFILLANPNAQAADVTIDYLLSDGTTYTKSYTVPADSRFTVWVDDEQIPAGSGARPLDNVAVSSTITSANSVPIIVERTMWWPSPALTANFWTEAHNSAGATATGTRWALAEGEAGGAANTETYILIANTSATPGQARVTLYFEDGTSAQRTLDLAARSRTNVAVSTDFSEAAGRRFGAIVESLGTTPAQIVVERAMYTSPGGVTWAAGNDALATRLP